MTSCFNMKTNITANNGSETSLFSEEQDVFSIGTIAAYSSIYGLISSIALVGNILVCLVIIKNPAMRTVTNVFLFNLAISDIMFIIVSVPALLSMKVTTRWLFGEVVCKGVPFLNTVTLSASIYTMVALAIDRYNAVVHPLRAKATNTIKRARVVIATIWILSAIVSLPQILTQSISKFGNDEYCYDDWTDLNGKTGKRVYVVSCFVIFFAVPMAIITVAYVTIIKQLKTTDCLLAETVKFKPDRNTEGRELLDETPTPISRNNRKTTLMMLTVIVAFLVCMLPINVLLVVSIFIPDKEKNNQALLDAHAMLSVLSVCSAACNPVIYNFFSVKFRRAFLDVIRSCCSSKDKVSRDQFASHASMRTKASTVL